MTATPHFSLTTDAPWLAIRAFRGSVGAGRVPNRAIKSAGEELRPVWKQVKPPFRAVLAGPVEKSTRNPIL